MTHAAWLFLADSSLRQRALADLDCLALLLAALCHDLEHPGTTNAFQVNTQSALAVRYNDASVRENHHAACAWGVLARARLLAPLRAEEARALRRTMLAAILATDMSAHQTLLASVEASLVAASAPAGADPATDAARRAQPGAFAFDRDSAEDRQLLVCFLLHCADLCNPLFAPQLSRRVAADLGREFAAQAAAERRAGMAVTVMLADDDAGAARLEIGFLDYGAWQGGKPSGTLRFTGPTAAHCVRAAPRRPRSGAPAVRHAGARQPGPGQPLPAAHRRQPRRVGGARGGQRGWRVTKRARRRAAVPARHFANDGR